MRFQFAMASFIYLICNAILKFVQRIFFPRPFPETPKTILVYRTGHLGDTICAIPALQAIQKRFPNSRRILLTNKKKGNLPFSKEIIERFVSFDKVLLYDPRNLFPWNRVKTLIRLIKGALSKGESIDMLFYMVASNATLFRQLRDMFFFKIIGCRSVVGFRVNIHRFFKLAQREFGRFDTETVRLMKIAQEGGVSSAVEWNFPEAPYPLPFDARENKKRPLIAVHPSANIPVKKWPLERFIEVSRWLQERYQARFVVVGGKDAVEEAKILTDSLPGEVVDLTGKTDFLETADILRQCDFLLSNDSGPVHLAAALQVPTVVIFSAREYPNVWYPYGEIHKVLRKDVGCQICHLKECPIMICLKQISVQEVMEACRALLEQQKSPTMFPGTIQSRG